VISSREKYIKAPTCHIEAPLVGPKTAQWQKGTRNTAEAAKSHKPEMLMLGMEGHNRSLTMSEPSVHE
jgi:hypothetical protein